MSAAVAAPALAHGAMVERILRAYDVCSEEQRAMGRDWYARALGTSLAIAAQYAHLHGPTGYQVAGIIAALSPRTAWRTNVEWAREIVRARAHRKACPPVGTGANRAKAWRIARGEDPLEVLGGPKVRAFFRAICGDCDAVCVDVWAIRVATGETFQPTDRQYAEIAAAYATAARARGIPARDIQAATWVHARGAAD